MWNKEKLIEKGFKWFSLVYKDFADREKVKKLSDNQIVELYEKETGKKVLTNKTKENGSL